MRHTFINAERPLITAMIKRTRDIDECIDEIERCREAGAEAYGFQFDNLPRKYHNEKDLGRIFDAMSSLPVYATNYKLKYNEDISYDSLADELLLFADMGAALVDITGDYFLKSPDELTFDKEAMEKQRIFAENVKKRGSEFLMSSHVNKFTPAERVLEIALEHQKRGADVSKIVVHSNTLTEQAENMRITALLGEKLNIKYLFLSGGDSCFMQRRLGILLGNCASLCMLERLEGESGPTVQPLIDEQKIYRDELNLI